MTSYIAKNLLQLNQNISDIKKRCNINYDINIIAVTKYASPEQIEGIIKQGLTCLGENYVQSVLKKQALFEQDNVSWHMIGHLQSNKVKKAINIFNCIQSIDSLQLLEKTNSELTKINKEMPVLLQVNIDKEVSKSGFSSEELLQNLDTIFSFSKVRIKGIMVIAPDYKQDAEIRLCFQKGKKLFDTIKSQHAGFDTLSMGMSTDYHIAIEEGSNMIRLGSCLFKEK
jgi:PLP dependent protein